MLVLYCFVEQNKICKVKVEHSFVDHLGDTYVYSLKQVEYRTRTLIQVDQRSCEADKRGFHNRKQVLVPQRNERTFAYFKLHLGLQHVWTKLEMQFKKYLRKPE